MDREFRKDKDWGLGQRMGGDGEGSRTGNGEGSRTGDGEWSRTVKGE